MAMLCRPLCDIRVFNKVIASKIQRMRGARRGPNDRTRAQGYEELRLALQVGRLQATRTLAQLSVAWQTWQSF